MSEFLRELTELNDFSTADNIGYSEMLNYFRAGSNERFNELDFED